MPEPHTIVLSFDGLRAASLGAYGQSAYETPGFNRLAAETTLHEWCYADSSDIVATCRALHHQFTPPKGSLLASDASELLEGPFGEAFTERTQLHSLKPSNLAESIAETALAATLGQWAELLVSQREQCLEDSSPVFAWFHTRGLYGAWDAPIGLVELLLDEGDPSLGDGVAPPELFRKDLDESTWCEARFAASCRYAAQIMVLDACVESLVELIEGLFEGEEVQLLLFGLRGYPLGEHAQIGGIDPGLYNEQQQVPLLVRTLNVANRFSRVPSPTTLSAALASTLAPASPPSGTDGVRLTSPEGTRAIHTQQWFLRLPPTGKDAPQPEIFVKPDDRWEQNNVASLCPDATDRLLAKLAEKPA